ncbi:MAG: hypothetical protein VCD00_08620 [Candidatus Hydrogenedentota bacterium]
MRSRGLSMIHPYASRKYVEALAGDKSEVVDLPDLGTHVLLRPIKGTGYIDAMGPYPCTPFNTEGGVEKSFEPLRALGTVSLTLVSDALERKSEEECSAFDFVRPYKKHYLSEGEIDESSFSAHHRRDIRRAQRFSETREISLDDYFSEWIAMYEGLAERHDFSAFHRFDRNYFEALSDLAGLITIGVFIAEELVSCHLWIRSELGSYSHLAASSERGYDIGAAYAAYAYSLNLLNSSGPVDLGGVADTNAGGGDGLDKFKAGFSNSQAINYICGAILRPNVYRQLSSNRMTSNDRYFPLYRGPEKGEISTLK